MKKSTLSALVAIGLGTVTVGNANAFTITSGNSSVDGSEIGLTGWTVDGVNHLYEQAWWFNASSNVGSTPFNYELADYDATPTETAGGANNLLQQFQVLGFDVDINYSVLGGSAGSGSSGLTENISIKNTTNASGSFTLYQYTDFDLGGYSPYDSNANNVGDGTNGLNYGQNDTINQVSGNYVTQTNNIWGVTETSAVPMPSLSSIGQAVALTDDLWDGTVTGTANGDSFTGDAAWIWQYTFNIAAGDSVSISKSMVVESIVPVPAAAWLFGSGLLGLAGFARRRA